MQLARAQPAELTRDLRRADPRRLEHGRAAYERHGGASGGGRRAAAVGVEPGVGHAIGLDAE